MRTSATHHARAILPISATKLISQATPTASARRSRTATRECRWARVAFPRRSYLVKYFEAKTQTNPGAPFACSGTGFLATPEARVTDSYKRAICAARSEDIVWTNKLAGTNSSVIRTAQIEEGGLKVNAVIGYLLRNPYTKLVTRTLMLTRAIESYKKAAFDEDYQVWQAGRGVDSIHEIESCAEILARFAEVTKRQAQ